MVLSTYLQENHGRLKIASFLELKSDIQYHYSANSYKR